MLIVKIAVLRDLSQLFSLILLDLFLSDFENVKVLTHLFEFVHPMGVLGHESLVALAHLVDSLPCCIAVVEFAGRAQIVTKSEGRIEASYRSTTPVALALVVTNISTFARRPRSGEALTRLMAYT